MSTSAAPCDRELAGTAQTAFESSEYDKAVSTLETLGKERATDAKVAHNLAVARYYAGKLPAGTEAFFKAAQAAKRQMQGQDQETDAGAEDFDDEAECAVISYNLAVVMYQRRHFNDALQMLERVFKIIEAVEENVAQTVCLLLLDLYIAKQMLEKAGFVIVYLEKILANGLKAKDEAKGDSGGGDGGDGDGSKSPDRELLKFYLHQYKARVHIMSRSMKASKREIKSALNLSNQNVTALFLKSNFEYVRHNYRKSVKLLNSCPKSSPHVSGQSLAVLYYNNLGCVHFQMGKFTLAGFYFNKAIDANEREAGRLPQIKGFEHTLLGTAVSDRLHELLYNQGLVMLHLKKARRAHTCFKQGLLFTSHRPFVWLRLAECCILEHWLQRSNGGGEGDEEYAVARAVGTAQNRKLVIKRSFNLTTMAGPLSLGLAVSYLNNALQLLARDTAPPPAAPATTKKGGGVASSKAASGAGAGGSAAGSPVPPSSGLAGNSMEAALMRCHIRSNLAYCYLGLGDMREVLRQGQSLLDDVACPGTLRFLAHVYMAEANIRKGSFSDAVQHLSPDNIGDLSDRTAEGSAADDGGGEAEAATTEQHPPAFTVESAKTTLLLNLAAAYCLKDDCDQAATVLGQLREPPRASHQAKQAVLLSVYVELRRGRHEAALEIVKRNQRPQVA